MPADSRIGWVQQNRVRKARVRRVGKVVGALAQALEVPESAVARAAASMVAGLVDQEFVRHCRIAASESGGIVVNVDEVALVCPMRMRWLNALGAALSQGGRQRPVAGVVFQYGKTGVQITDRPRRQS